MMQSKDLHLFHNATAFDSDSNMPARSKRRSQLFLPPRLARPHLAPSSCIFKPSLLMFRLRHNLRHHQPVPLAIHRNKRQICRSLCSRTSSTITRTPTSIEVLKARFTLAFKISNSPTRTGATKSR